MAGYKRPNLRLVFTDGEFEGLEVVSKRFSLGDLRLFDSYQADPIGLADQFFEMVAGRIVSWNLLDDNDEPVPVGLKSVVDLDFTLLDKVVSEIIRGSRKRVDIPLETGSPNGDPEPQIPVQPLEEEPPQ